MLKAILGFRNWLIEGCNLTDEELDDIEITITVLSPSAALKLRRDFDQTLQYICREFNEKPDLAKISSIMGVKVKYVLPEKWII